MQLLFLQAIPGRIFNMTTVSDPRARITYSHLFREPNCGEGIPPCVVHLHRKLPFLSILCRARRASRAPTLD